MPRSESKLRNFFKKHPIFSATTIVSVPTLFFAAVAAWEPLTGQSFHDWLRALGGWGGLLSMSLQYVTWIIGGIIIYLYCLILYEVRQHKNDVGWLEDIADEEEKQLVDKIQSGRYSIRRNFQNRDPYLEFTYHFHNLTVYTLTLKKLEGDMLWDNHSFPHEAKVVEADYTLKHGESRSLYVRQHLSRETAQEINGQLPNREDGENHNYFMQHLNIRLRFCFAYTDRWGDSHEVQI